MRSVTYVYLFSSIIHDSFFLVILIVFLGSMLIHTRGMENIIPTQRTVLLVFFSAVEMQPFVKSS